MNIKLKKYSEQLQEWPERGYHIMAQYDENEIVVYQSYRPEIGNFAVKNQFFGGAFSLNRMTWIKPNFLWMMYRNGWAQKEGQEVVLAIHLKINAFERYLQQAVWSTNNAKVYTSHDEWKKCVADSDIRLQWDPDHDPYGDKVERKAIQIGIRNKEITRFSKEDIIQIEDITPFVLEQYEHVKAKQLQHLIIPLERPLVIDDIGLIKNLNISSY